MGDFEGQTAVEKIGEGRHRTDLAEEGLIGAEMRVWSGEGKLLASGSSHLSSRPRPERYR